MTRTAVPRLARAAASLAAALTLALASQGCAGLVPHSPRTDLVQELGYEAAAAELKLVLTRALAPSIQEVTVTPESFSIQSMEYVYWAGMVHGRAVFWKNIGRVDVYENAHTFVIDLHGRETLAVDYASVDDALRYADLVMSFRAWALGGGGDWPAAGPGPNAPGGKPPEEEGAERRTEDVLQQE